MTLTPQRARVREGLLAAAATTLAVWPLTTLLDENDWVAPVLLLVGLLAGVGMAVRTLGAPAWSVPIAQLGVYAVAVVANQLDVSDPGGWPDQIGLLLDDAHRTITRYAAPAPTSVGIVFVLVATVPLLAVLVDLIAVTAGMPAAAGIPLLAIFLFSTANSGDQLSPVYFLALALAWVLLLSRAGLERLRRWSSAEAYARTPELSDDRLGMASHAARARALGVVALLLALVLPHVIPHMPTQFVGDGLGRGRGSGEVASVGFTDTLDLSRDLNSRDQTPVLRYATSDTTPPPLRVLSMARYAGGSWLRSDPETVRTGEDDGELPLPEGMSPRVPTTRERIRVTGNGMSPPYLATPWPVVSVDTSLTRWVYSPDEVQPRVDERASSYEATYAELGPGAEPIGERQPSPPVSPLTLQQDKASQSVVTSRAQQIVADAGADDDLQKGIALQTWFRSNGGFTYSLTLAPTRKGPDGRPLDPISNFLATKVGYCTQFATSMVMMARSLGIPARIAVGFLPGSPQGNRRYEVRAADAHAWPELWLPGMGWTRFEPTPSVRATEVPEYTEDTSVVPRQKPSDEATPTPSATATPSPTPSPSATPTPTPQPRDDDTAPRFWERSGFWWTLGILLLGLIGSAVLPLAARWRRQQAFAEADTPQQQVEAQWRDLTSRLDDLGIEEPQGLTPRQMEQHYRQRATLEGEGRQALGRAVQTLETARYAPPERSPRTLGEDGQRVLHEVRDDASWGTRVAALLFPRTGRRAVRDLALSPFRRWRGRRSDDG